MTVEKFVNTGEVLLDVKHVKKYYPIEAGMMKKQVGTVKAVDDISLYINRNETLGLVGEWVRGKTTLGRAASCGRSSPRTARFCSIWSRESRPLIF